MNIIIVGDGKMGFALSRQLSEEGHDVMVVDSDSEVLEKTRCLLDVDCMQGNGVDKVTLEDAHAADADLLIAATPQDELNLLCCLLAKKLGTSHTIARIRNPEYMQSVALMREELGLSMVINPEMEAAIEIFRLLRFPSALKIDFFSKGRAELLEFKVALDSPMIGLSLAAIRTKYRLKVLVCAVERKGQVYIPDGNFILREGDVVNVTASPQDISAFFRRTGVYARKVKNVMIVGGGRISYYLAKRLSDAGVQVKIIEENKARCQQLADALPKVMVIHGDGLDQELLQEESLDSMDALVALTGLDEQNVIVAMYASLQQTSKVIAKINHINLTGILEKCGVECTVTPHLISVNQIVRYVRAMQNSLESSVESLVKIVNDRAEALEFRVKRGFDKCGIPLKNLKFKRNFLIGVIVRGNQVICPGGDDVILVDDSVIVVTTNSGLEELADVFE